MREAHGAIRKLLYHFSVSITEKYYQEELYEDKVAAALNEVLSRKGSNGKIDEDRADVQLCPAKLNRPILKLIKSNS